MLQAALRYGPAPRSILASLVDPVGYKDSVATFLSRLDHRRSSEALSKIHLSPIIWIRPSGGTKYPRSCYELYIPTQYIACRITQAISNQDELTRKDLLRTINSFGLGAACAFASYLLKAEIDIYLMGGGKLEVNWCSSPFRENHTLPTAIARSEPRTFLFEMPLVVQHCNKPSLAEVPSFYWRPHSPSFPSIDAILYAENTIFAVQTSTAWSDPPVTSALHQKMWTRLTGTLNGLITLGARVAHLHLVDTAAKGAQLCENDKGSMYPVGYCVIEGELSANLEKFQVSILRLSA